MRNAFILPTATAFSTLMHYMELFCFEFNCTEKQAEKRFFKHSIFIVFHDMKMRMEIASLLVSQYAGAVHSRSTHQRTAICNEENSLSDDTSLCSWKTFPLISGFASQKIQYNHISQALEATQLSFIIIALLHILFIVHRVAQLIYENGSETKKKSECEKKNFNDQQFCLLRICRAKT